MQKPCDAHNRLLIGKNTVEHPKQFGNEGVRIIEIFEGEPKNNFTPYKKFQELINRSGTESWTFP